MTGAVWKDAGSIDQIPAQGARVVRTPLGDVAVFRTGEGDIFAIEDRCPHQDGPLSEGMVHGAQVTCPLHNWVIDLVSGDVVGPDQGCVAKIPIRVDEERILLDLSVLSRQVA